VIALKESIEIRSAPEEVFDWFRNLDKNYAGWHSDHIKWIFEGGFREGARCQYEERLHGDPHIARATLVRIEKDRLIEFRHIFPLSIVCPGGSFTIERRADGSLFTATLRFRAGWLFSVLMPRRVDAVKHHMKEEGQNLKRLLERTATEPRCRSEHEISRLRSHIHFSEKVPEGSETTDVQTRT